MKKDRSTIHCPRCGYDQRGVVATWTDACPLRGTCTECGLGFDWGPVIVPHNFEPAWCVEFARSTRQFMDNCWRTLRGSFLPWRFWSRLQMSHPIRWKPLAAYVLLMAILPGLLVYISEQTTVAIMVRTRVQAQLMEQLKQEKAWASQLQALVDSSQFESFSDLQQQSILGQIDYLKQLNPNQVSVEQPYLVAIAEAVFLPFAATSRGSMSTSIGALQYIPPNSLHEWLFGQLGWRADVQTQDTVAIVILGLFGNVVLTLLLPVGFIFLPVSRRRAKVRWRHIARVFANGATMCSTAGWVCVLTFLCAAVLGSRGDTLLRASALMSTAGIVVLTNIWWAVAIKRYLKMPHGWAIAPLLTVVILLFPVAMISSVDPEFSIGVLQFGALLSSVIFLGVLLTQIFTRLTNRPKAKPSDEWGN